MDWNQHYPEFLATNPNSRVEFLDVGCGYGGLLGNLQLFET